MKRISAKEYGTRRRRLMELMAEGSIAIVPSAEEVIRNNDIHFDFRQNSDFHYLTGFPEPSSLAVLMPGRAQGEFLLFVRDKDPSKEQWHGRRAGPEGAVSDYGADDAFPIEDINDILPGLMEGKTRVYAHMGVNSEFDEQLMGWLNSIRSRVRQGAVPPDDFSDIAHLLHDLRLVKSRQEIAIMTTAAKISAAAHRRAMQACKPGRWEYQLQAELEYHFRQEGSMRCAYGTIVGGGDNACTLHYVANNQKLQDGDLVLIDAGAEWEYYAADITRTIPVNGRFNPNQRAIYDLVLKAQYAAIAAIKPDADWNRPHEAAIAVITAGLIELGLLTGEVDQLIESGAYKEFFMHKTGHWLGIDAHDVGDYKVGNRWRLLEPGMVLTVEPGIYIPLSNRRVPPEWRGIGVRIEDEVLVTREGHQVLSSDVVKEADAIEALMQEGQAAQA